jgi:hypothetical protein
MSDAQSEAARGLEEQIARRIADRLAEITLPQRTSQRTATALAVLAVLMFGGVIAASCLLEDKSLQAAMFGSAATMAGQVFQFYFGSSRSSQTKDEAIATKLNAPGDQR